MSGLFITLEGTDGSGKTTQINRLKEYFSERKIVTFEALAKSEPDYAKLGEIRSHKIDTDPLYINFTLPKYSALIITM